tara:strand:+ start:635 stop:994 length:360 start_codon:yes stop_codon:yes gene_type:complete
MAWTLGYLDMNLDHIREYEDHGSLVTSDNVCLERRVRRGRHWNPKKWKDINSLTNPNDQVSGTIVGYVDETGLIGENIAHKYNQVQQGQTNWCVVQWDNGKRSVYPIGAEGIFALSFCD